MIILLAYEMIIYIYKYDWPGLPLPDSSAPPIHQSNGGLETVWEQLDCNFWGTYFAAFLPRISIHICLLEFSISSETTPAYHPQANGMVERWHRTLMSCNRQSDKNWAGRLLMNLLGLRARPHLDSGLTHQQAFRTDLTLPDNFASKEAKELDGADFYKQLKKVRDCYSYSPAVHHQNDDSKATSALRKAKFVLVHQDGHKPPLAEAYRGPYKVKSLCNNTYLLEGRNESKDQVAINPLKLFHMREGA